MTATTKAELLTYAESEIKRLKLGDTPTNCHGVVAHDDPAGVRLGDGVGLDVTCTTRDQIDSELQAMREWYDESE